MSRDRSLKGFSNALKPWWISLLLKMCHFTHCVCVYELLYIAYQGTYLLFDRNHCAPSFLLSVFCDVLMLRHVELSEQTVHDR